MPASKFYVSVPENFKTRPVEDMLKYNMTTVQRYLKFIALPAAFLSFVGAAVYFIFNSSSTTMIPCEHNDATNNYDCATEVTKSIDCHQYYITSAVHGDTQDIAAAKFNSVTEKKEPMLVCVHEYNLWSTLNNALVTSQTVWWVLIVLGTFFLKKRSKTTTVPDSVPAAPVPTKVTMVKPANSTSVKSSVNSRVVPLPGEVLFQ